MYITGTVVCPFVDVIDCDTFEYRPQDDGARGSFDWEFNYKRLPLLARDKLNPTEPFESPVMAGNNLTAINLTFYVKTKKIINRWLFRHQYQVVLGIGWLRRRIRYLG